MSTSMAEGRSYILLSAKKALPHSPFKGCHSTIVLAYMPQELSARFSTEISSKVLSVQGYYVEMYPSFMSLLEHYKLSY